MSEVTGSRKKMEEKVTKNVGEEGVDYENCTFRNFVNRIETLRESEMGTTSPSSFAVDKQIKVEKINRSRAKKVEERLGKR